MLSFAYVSKPMPYSFSIPIPILSPLVSPSSAFRRHKRFGLAVNAAAISNISNFKLALFDDFFYSFASTYYLYSVILFVNVGVHCTQLVFIKSFKQFIDIDKMLCKTDYLLFCQQVQCDWKRKWNVYLYRGHARRHGAALTTQITLNCTGICSDESVVNYLSGYKNFH